MHGYNGSTDEPCYVAMMMRNVNAKKPAKKLNVNERKHATLHDDNTKSSCVPSNRNATTNATNNSHNAFQPTQYESS